MPKLGYKQTEEHKKHISQSRLKMFEEMSEEEHKERKERNKQKTELKNYLYNQFMAKLHKSK